MTGKWHKLFTRKCAHAQHMVFDRMIMLSNQVVRGQRVYGQSDHNNRSMLFDKRNCVYRYVMTNYILSGHCCLIPFDAKCRYINTKCSELFVAKRKRYPSNSSYTNNFHKKLHSYTNYFQIKTKVAQAKTQRHLIRCCSLKLRKTTEIISNWLC